MATNTKNYNFKKPDESDFYDIQDQNGNWDIVDEKMEELSAPTFEDYSSTTSVPEASTAIEAIKSKKKIPEILANIKAAFKGVCLLGHIVNNCVTDNAKLPLSAAQGKALMDQITKLNSDLKSRLDVSHYISGSITAYADTCPIGLTVVVTGNDTTQMAGMTSRYTIGFVLNRASDSGVVILFSYSNNEIYMISKNETWDSKVSAK